MGCGRFQVVARKKQQGGRRKRKQVRSTAVDVLSGELPLTNTTRRTGEVAAVIDAEQSLGTITSRYLVHLARHRCHRIRCRVRRIQYSFGRLADTFHRAAVRPPRMTETGNRRQFASETAKARFAGTTVVAETAGHAIVQ